MALREDVRAVCREIALGFPVRVLDTNTSQNLSSDECAAGVHNHRSGQQSTQFSMLLCAHVVCFFQEHALPTSWHSVSSRRKDWCFLDKVVSLLGEENAIRLCVLIRVLDHPIQHAPGFAVQLFVKQSSMCNIKRPVPLKNILRVPGATTDLCLGGLIANMFADPVSLPYGSPSKHTVPQIFLWGSTVHGTMTPMLCNDRSSNRNLAMLPSMILQLCSLCFLHLVGQVFSTNQKTGE